MDAINRCIKLGVCPERNTVKEAAACFRERSTSDVICNAIGVLAVLFGRIAEPSDKVPHALSVATYSTTMFLA